MLEVQRIHETKNTITSNNKPVNYTYKPRKLTKKEEREWLIIRVKQYIEANKAISDKLYNRNE